MRKLFVFLVILMVAYTGAQAGLFRESVDLADLAQLSSESLVTLKDTEFEVFLAEVRLAGVKAALKGAQDESKKAKRTHGTASSEERGHE